MQAAAASIYICIYSSYTRKCHSRWAMVSEEYSYGSDDTVHVSDKYQRAKLKNIYKLLSILCWWEIKDILDRAFYSMHVSKGFIPSGIKLYSIGVVITGHKPSNKNPHH